ncbi:hypothetical protein NLU13_1716 [Sarocladium strictum]|uniref:Small ribosomal subunit protein mS41 n=1 Tax=Sarocladium strictum TaxID=5046 RepID=A0AA39GS94_SARSR|nr:hypothetical protein NLU13_1716 [Sarocladium strictum]
MRLQCFRQPLRQFAQQVAYPPVGAVRSLHKTRPAHEIPKPIPFVPDVNTFLTLIGRGLNKHASKFPTWESLWSVTGPQLQELGIEPAGKRKYLLEWMHRYRRGSLGPGGDFRFVNDGQALLRVALSPKWPHKQRLVVNVPFEPQAIEADTTEEAGQVDAKEQEQAGEEAADKEVEKEEIQADEPAPDSYPRPRLYKVRGLRSIAGPYAIPVKQGSIVKVTEGMWEHKEGRKIDGGERRRAEVRFKRRSAERRAEREAEMLGNM